MGVVTNITIATTGGLTNQIAPDTQSHEQNQELKEIGGMLVESLIVMDFREAEEYTPLKVCVLYYRLIFIIKLVLTLRIRLQKSGWGIYRAGLHLALHIVFEVQSCTAVS